MRNDETSKRLRGALSDPMNETNPDYLERAVESMALALIGCGWDDADAYDVGRREHDRSPRAQEVERAKEGIDADLTEALEAAEPFIRADERQRIEEGLRPLLEIAAQFMTYQEIEGRISAALASLASNSETEGAQDGNA